MALDDRGMAARVEEIRSELDSLLGEVVVAFGSFAAPGYLYSGMRRRGVPGTTWWRHFRNRAGWGRDGALPLQLYLAVTESRIVAVSMETSWRSSRVGFPIEVARSWDRSFVTVDVVPGPDGPEVVLTEAGDSTRVHSADHGRGFNDAVLRMLGA